ncbi:DUF4072 domain-containing protein [Aquitalea magnusonii]|uniref:DUF4072 domain-containing protein n=1 Tax=Aquitalea magnusonii TaxID=332411 RepID=UPI00128FC2F6|nr:DUF4072 domain-containing protein [Aquitalea magnusonii]
MSLTLVIQSPRLDSKELQELAALAGASRISQPSLECARLEQATRPAVMPSAPAARPWATTSPLSTAACSWPTSACWCPIWTPP